MPEGPVSRKKLGIFRPDLDNSGKMVWVVCCEQVPSRLLETTRFSSQPAIYGQMVPEFCIRSGQNQESPDTRRAMARSGCRLGGEGWIC
jgi:hypothetical protein